MDYPRPWIEVYKRGGVSYDLQFEKISLHSLLARTVENFPEKTAMIFFGREISYRQLGLFVERLASALSGLGVRKGDRVALMLPNCPDFVVSYYALLRLGAIVVNTNPMYVEREIEHQVNDSQSKMIITLADLYPRVKNVSGKTPLERVLLTGFAGKPELPEGVLWLPDLYLSERPPALPVEIDPVEDIAVLQYTGGTTGVPKAAALTHFNLYANTTQVNHFFQGEENKKVILSVLPFFHVYGMTCCMNLAVAVGATMILVPRFNPAEIAQIISQYRPTFFPGVPTMFLALLNYPEFKEYSTVMVYSSGAAPLPREVFNGYAQKLAGSESVLAEGYGLSEASPVTHSNPVFGENKPGSIGIPYPATECKIMDTETGTRVMPVGEIGELVIKGPQVMKGYWNRPEETARTLRDGWLYTGDLARMDEDGYFYIVDRKKDLIIAGGYNIYPREVEEVLYTHPKVLEAVVAGVPDPYRGETVKAYIVLKPGETATEDEITEFCRERLAAYKVPRLVEFRAELPKSAVGKLLRRVLVAEETKKE
ncbi:MAG: long-chain-fatty-acid--CoA ligase [Desulfotomaculales bacterium]